MSLLERVQAAGNVAPTSLREVDLLDTLKGWISRTISLDTLAAMVKSNPEQARSEIKSICREAFQTVTFSQLSLSEQERLMENLIDSIFGLGPLEGLLADESVTEIMVNGTRSIYYEKAGVLFRSGLKFESDEQVRALIDRILSPLGRRIDEASPMVSARLSQGHRVHAIIPPLALDGPVLTIRTFSSHVITLQDMVESKSIDTKLRVFLIQAVQKRKNIAVTGGTGSGKTTLLNALSCHISSSERIITIEDSAELRFLEHPHVVRLEARPRSAEGTGEVSIRDLVITSLRMRPDRIIVGECRGGEALDMLTAMNTGHSGSLTTLHANSPAEAISRLVTLVRYAAELPVDVIESHIASALDLIVQTARSSDGSRFVSEVASISFDQEERCCKVEKIYTRSVTQAEGIWHLDYCPESRRGACYDT